MTVAEGQDVELACAAQGFPVPTYVWSRNSQPIRQMAFNRIRQIDGSLSIRQVMLSDAGVYRCTVNNSVGSEMIETQLIVTGKTSAHTNNTIQSNTSHTNPAIIWVQSLSLSRVMRAQMRSYHRIWQLLRIEPLLQIMPSLLSLLLLLLFLFRESLLSLLLLEFFTFILRNPFLYD